MIPAVTGPMRVHFVSGLAGASAAGLMRVLAQNPRFAPREASGALALYEAASARCARGGTPEAFLRPAQRRALLRGLFAAVHHDIAPGTAVFDSDPGWIEALGGLAPIFPLARFLLVLPFGARGHPAQVGPQAAQVVPIASDRLRDAPEVVLDEIYHALREPGFHHDLSPFSLPEAELAPVFRAGGGLFGLFGRRRRAQPAGRGRP
ncbi:MAG: hypothetical protein CVT80_06690 [Alphaproteobacteria bacterium HGW-Alphaproteobacteria-2]|nr:MAG: hypothetical protein CVT80_06690 [Alphaproteobacteria bacterium HGW-Alphaproteobacteria-2]